MITGSPKRSGARRAQHGNVLGVCVGVAATRALRPYQLEAWAHGACTSLLTSCWGLLGFWGFGVLVFFWVCGFWGFGVFVVVGVLEFVSFFFLGGGGGGSAFLGFWGFGVLGFWGFWAFGVCVFWVFGVVLIEAAAG